MYYRIKVAGLERDLPVCPLNENISIAGFGDGAAARVCRPQLTTVRLPLAAMAAEAARRPPTTEPAEEAPEAWNIAA